MGTGTENTPATSPATDAPATETLATAPGTAPAEKNWFEMLIDMLKQLFQSIMGMFGFGENEQSTTTTAPGTNTQQTPSGQTHGVTTDTPSQAAATGAGQTTPASTQQTTPSTTSQTTTEPKKQASVDTSKQTETIKEELPATPPAPLVIGTFSHDQTKGVEALIADYDKRYNAEQKSEADFWRSVRQGYTNTGPNSDERRKPDITRNNTAQMVYDYREQAANKPQLVGPNFGDWEIMDAKMGKAQISDNPDITADKIFQQGSNGKIAINIPSEGMVRIDRAGGNKFRVTVYPTDLPELLSSDFSANFKPAYVELTREQLEKQTTFVAPEIGNAGENNSIRITTKKSDGIRNLQVMSEGATIKVSGTNSQVNNNFQQDYQVVMEERGKAIAAENRALLEQRRAQVLAEQAVKKKNEEKKQGRTNEDGNERKGRMHRTGHGRRASLDTNYNSFGGDNVSPMGSQGVGSTRAIT